MHKLFVSYILVKPHLLQEKDHCKGIVIKYSGGGGVGGETEIFNKIFHTPTILMKFLWEPPHTSLIFRQNLMARACSRACA